MERNHNLSQEQLREILLTIKREAEEFNNVKEMLAEIELYLRTAKTMSENTLKDEVGV